MDGQAQSGEAPAISLTDIFRAEARAINRRRVAANERDKNLKLPLLDVEKTGTGTVQDITALALSGGGIRSASVCLGVLQALNEHKCFPRIDYLSTVSGGGYMGSALTATMTKSNGEFVFGKSRRDAATETRPPDVMDTPQVGHLRNYSNYLMPFGMRDVVTALAVITRGLVANGAIVFGCALLVAAITILGNPKRSELLLPNLFHYQLKDINLWGWQPLLWLTDMHFGVTLLLALIGAPLFYFWAIGRSAISPPSATSKAAFYFWWGLITIAYVILATVVWLGFGSTAEANSSFGFLFALLVLLIVAFAIGHHDLAPGGPTFLQSHDGWTEIAMAYFIAAVVFFLALWESNLLFEASLLLLPTSSILLLSARLVGPAPWVRRSLGDAAEFRTWPPFIYASYLVLFAFFVVAEFQPFVLAGMFDLYDAANVSRDSNHSMLAEFIKWVATIATPIAAVVTFFREQIGTLFKSVTTSSRFSTKLLALVVSAATWIGGAAVPLLIWIGYLYLCFWGIENDGKPNTDVRPPRPSIQGTIKIEGPGVDLSATIKCGPGARDDCAPPLAVNPQERPAGKTDTDQDKAHEHAPTWLINAANFAAESYSRLAILIRPPNDRLDTFMSNWCVACVLSPVFSPVTSLFREQVTGLYALAAIVLLWLSWWLRPNANSLHQLYRDRLSKAFLFHPTLPDDWKSSVHSAVDPSFAPIGTMRLTELAPKVPHAPYHLINATLNVQGSDFANRRGRNSDFFLFSPLYVGSQATHYAKTTDMERATNLDLATAMTISGAAFSPNAGAASITALTPTLALLNVRTGYWLRNPGFVPRAMEGEGRPLEGKRRPFSDSNLYLWAELTGRLREDSEEVFLSDGGHIENLGVYELLRRRCRIIIAVDAEADPSLRYPSFIALQRYARIDLGVRISMPWDDIRKTTLCWMGYTGDPSAVDKDKTSSVKVPKPSLGPHVSIGTITYDGGEQGWLVYIKASLTGDENDYVRDYARRYEAFPHESTGDQFFNEEQFEVYRALGFHITNRWLSGGDTALVHDEDKGPVNLNIRARHTNVDPVRRALFN